MHALGPIWHHGRLVEDVQGPIEGSEREYGGRRGHKGLHPFGRFVLRLEVERTCVTEPARQRILQDALPGGTYVHEGRRARAAVQVLVPTPRREVDLGLVDVERNGAGGVREIPEHERAGVVHLLRDALQVEHLAVSKVDVRQHHERHVFAESVVERAFASTRPHRDGASGALAIAPRCRDPSGSCASSVRSTWRSGRSRSAPPMSLASANVKRVGDDEPRRARAPISGRRDRRAASAWPSSPASVQLRTSLSSPLVVDDLIDSSQDTPRDTGPSELPSR